MKRWMQALAWLALAGCGSQHALGVGLLDEDELPTRRAEPLLAAVAERVKERCDGKPHGRRVASYDASGDGQFDVRKVLTQVGEGPGTRQILICRELDLDGDGRHDVVRLYDDEGQVLLAEADRDFDGRIDLVTFYHQGQVLRQEMDERRDGLVDTKIFFEDRKAVRTERDLAQRSTEQAWRPDRWEYFEDGRLIRVGADLDGDGVIDRWDRDEEFFADERDRAGDADADAAQGGR